MVFVEVETQCEEIMSPDELSHKGGQPLDKAIIFHLLKTFTDLEPSKIYGYYIAIYSINSISDVQVNDRTDNLTFPVSVKCMSMIPCKGEILIGTVVKVMMFGIFLNSGPADNIFLSKKFMKDYEFRMSNEPFFYNVSQQSRLERDTKVRFKVLGTKWSEMYSELQIQATLDGGYLGPI